MLRGRVHGSTAIRKRLLLIASFLAVTVAMSVVLQAGQIESAYTTDGRGAKEDIGPPPLSFTPNEGQFEESVLYRVDAGGAVTWITEDGVFHQFFRPADTLAAQQDTTGLHDPESPPLEFEQVCVRSHFVGAQYGSGNVAPEDVRDFKYNYIQGNDPSAWRTDVLNYGAVRFDEIYPGVSLRYFGTENELEYDIIVAPGADPSAIRIAYENASSLAVSDSGYLEVGTPFGTMSEKKPRAYQAGGKRGDVECEFQLLSDSEFQFKLPNGYDSTQTLVIDPVVIYSVQYGASWYNGYYPSEARGIAADASGNAYWTGYTGWSSFPRLNPYQPSLGAGYDAFLSKFDQTGSLVYSTYFGGNNHDYGNDIVVDDSEQPYIVGYTYSTDLPVYNALQPTRAGSSDAFLTKFNSSGSGLVYSTYLGGSNSDFGMGIALDDADQVCVTGYTLSTSGFPLVGAIQSTNAGGYDGFVTKFSSDGSSLLFSTFMGGTSNEYAQAVACDDAGQIFVAGYTSSDDFPTEVPYQPARVNGYDAFVFKLNSAGSALIFSTYLGGENTDYAYGIATDANGNAYVAGNSLSTSFPTANAIQPSRNAGYDAFVSKFSPDGQTLSYSTYLGGSGDDFGRSIAVSPSGEAHIVGYTSSPDFPLYDPLGSYHDRYDSFITKYNAAGSAYEYSTYGSLSSSYHDYAYDVALDDVNCAYMCGERYYAYYSSSYYYYYEGLWAQKICPDNSPPVAICHDVQVNADANCQAAASIDNGSYDPDGDPVTIVQIPPGPYNLGVTNVTLTITDDGGLSDQCTANVTVVDVTPPTITCPPQANVQCIADVPAANPALCLVNDNCDPNPAVVHVGDVSDGNICPETITRTYKATDASGNFATCTQTIIVDDTQKPTINCPANIQISCEASTLPANTGQANANDNCDPNPTITYTDAITPGACDDEKTITRTWKATDFCNNSETCDQIITVVDNTPPTITCPANATIPCDGSTDPSSTGTPNVNDNCDPAPNVTYADNQAGNVITRTWTATDRCGNSNNCTQTITLLDTVPPEIDCPAIVNVQCPDDVPTPNPSLITVTDNCDPNPTLVHLGDVSDGNTCPETITRTYQAEDASGNTSQCLQTIVINDTVDPVITCPPNTTVECDESIDPSNTGTATATDNCNSVTVTYSDSNNGNTINRTWTATDLCNNTASCVQEITIEDTEPPTITCPANIAVQCLDDVPAPDINSCTVYDNCDPDPLVIHDGDLDNGQTCPKIITRTYRAYDNAGNSADCQQTITVNDTEDPVITCPADITIECDESTHPNNTGSATATDNCDNVYISYTDATTQGSCDDEYTITRTWVARDDCNNTAQCVQTITVVDDTPPVISCPPDVDIDCNESSDPSNTGYATATDNCDANPTVTYFDTQNDNVISRSWVAEDNCGNTSTCVQIITILDTTPPVVTCPANVTVQCPDQVPPVDIGAVTATDDCDPNPVVTHVGDVSDGNTCPEIITRTYRATDAAGNYAECTQTITIHDTTPPVLTCPDDFETDNYPGECQAIVTFEATATDNCPGAVTITYSQDPGTYFPVGITKVTVTATDLCNNQSTCEFYITVHDTEPPVAICPANIAVDNDLHQCGAVVNFAATVTDNCPGATVSCSPASGSFFDVGTTTVTCTATDASGNTSFCTFTVTVYDTEVPEGICPSDIDVNNDAGLCGAFVDFTATVEDNCPGATITCNPVSGSFFAVGATMVTCTARDAAGNEMDCHFTINVHDTEPPTAICPADITVENDPDVCGAVVTFAATVTDNCPGATVSCVPSSGSTFPVGATTVTCTAVDAAGNTDECSFTVTVLDTQNPLALCPNDITVPNDPNLCGAYVTWDPEVEDNCPGATVTCSPGSGTFFPIGTTVVTCVATDAAGNVGNCTFTITVVDTENPVAICPDDITVPNDPGECGAVVNFTAQVEDNCPGATVTCDPPSGTLFPVGVTAVTCTAIDASGNVGECSFTVTVLDVEDPVAICPADMVVPNDPGDCGAVVEFDSEVQDNCPGATIGCSPPSGSFFPVGTTVVTCIAVDASGNSANCTFSVTVLDIENPVPQCPADIYVDNDPSMCEAVVTFAATVTDNCPGASVACVPPSGSFFPVGTTVVTCTATDAANNTAQCTFNVIVSDGENPVVTCPADIGVECIEDVPEADIGLVTATDNCTAAPTITWEGDVSDGNICPEIITRTYRATDDAGNYAECVQTITVDDDIPPEFPPEMVCDDTTYWDCGSIVDPGEVFATDNCDPNPIMSFTEEYIDGDCPQEHTLVWTWTATDFCGNAASCQKVLHFVDTIAPECSVPNDTTIFLCEPGEVSLPVNCTDNCDGLIYPQVISGPGQVLNNFWHYTPSADEVVTVTVECEDDCFNASQCSFTVTFDINEPPVCEGPPDTYRFMCEPEQICLPYSSSDADGNLDSCYIVSGPGTLSATQWCYTPADDESHTVTVRCVDACGEFCEFSFDVDLEINDAPVVTCPDDDSVHWGETYQAYASATDENAGQSWHFSLGETSPEDAYINPHTGAISWPTDGEDVCVHPIAVIATDSCGAADTCFVDVCVENDPPVIACPDFGTWIYPAHTTTGTIGGYDSDGGPNDLVFSIVSYTGTATVDIDASTGEYTIGPDTDPVPTLGYFEDLCIAVSDGANVCSGCSPRNADTCCVTFQIMPTAVAHIEKTHGALQGHYEFVSLTIENSILEMGGFDFLIAYDASALTFMEATPGQLLEDCGWEYFTYRHGVEGNCGDACPSGLLRIIAMADQNNGPNHPSCYGPPDTDPHELAEMKFYVTNDRDFNGQYVPVRYFWDDCGDNSISDISGKWLYVDRTVYGFEGDLIWDEEDDATFPESARPAFVGAPDECMVGGGPDKPTPLRGIDLINGGVDIIPSDSIDDRGDLNLNGLANEISDAVLFTNYFLYGIEVFQIALEAQIAASDVNNDGQVLSVGDLVYLVRIITGDALPFPKLAPFAREAAVRFSGNMVSTYSDTRLGAVLLTFAVEGDYTVNNLTDMTVLDHAADGTLKVLVYDMSTKAIPSGSSEIVKLGGKVELLSAQVADYEGNLLTAKLEITALPEEYSLTQNYPNPFNPQTVIAFALPEAGEVQLEVYNIAGQRVATLVSDYLNAGYHDVVFRGVDDNGRQLSSGVYLYRLVAGDFTETRKMLLVK